jgi:hypothetical protein
MKIYMYILMAVLVLVWSGRSWAEDAVQAAGQGNDETVVSSGDTGDNAETQPEDSGDEEAWEETAEPAPMHYVLEPEIKTWLGFRIVDVEGSNRAMEYGWPSSSPTGGILLHYTPLPHRIDFELDMKNHNDYNAEFSYAYKDIFKLDYKGWALYHNLDHYVPQVSSSGSYASVDRDPGQAYHFTDRDNRISLRLKWPDRAYHLFATYRIFDRDGTIQQRFRASNPTAPPSNAKLSEGRDVDWMTSELTAGVNGHFGPVEVEYSHRYKYFDAHGVTALYDDYGAPLNVAIHNEVSDRETNIDTIKLHTDMTGRIVGSATFVNGNKKNKYSLAEVAFMRGYGDVILIPMEGLTVALRYRYQQLEENVPSTFGLYRDPLNTAVTAPAPPQDPIDNRVNSAEMSVRYSPSTAVSLKGTYKFTNTKKYNITEWNENPGEDILIFQKIPTSQNKHDMSVSAVLRPARNATIRGRVSYMYTHDPELPVDPRSSFNGRFTFTWLPVYNVSTNTYYRFSRDDNGSTCMISQRHNAGVSATWAPTASLSFYGGYDYFMYRNSRDLEFLMRPVTTSFEVISRPVLRDNSHVYYMGAGYKFEIPLSVDVEFHQSWSSSKFRTSDTLGTVSSDGLGDVSDVRIRETGGKFSTAYDLPKGWGVSAEYEINDYQDLKDKPQYGAQDGLAHTVTLLVKKEW